MRIFRSIRKKLKGVVRRLKSKFDELGSYTGSPQGEGKQPEQDADDL